MSSLSSFAFFPEGFAADMGPLSPRHTEKVTPTMKTLPVVLAVALLAACAGTDKGTSDGKQAGTPHPGKTAAVARPSAGGTAAHGWPTYHGDNMRSGQSAAPALKPPLRVAWRKQLDGAVYAQPLVVKGKVVVATEDNTVYAFRTGGHLLWRHHLGTPVPRSALPCGNIDPLG